MPCQIKNIQCDDSVLQRLFARLENAHSFADLVLVAWQLAQRLAVLLTEDILKKRAQRPTDWSNCPMCGQKLQSKGFAKRQLTTLIGVIRFKRRVGRCPAHCRIGQMAPLDIELELTSHQRSDLRLKRVACLLAVFVPFETAQNLFKAATIWLDGRTKKARGWFVVARHRLRHGPSMRVRMDIEQALADQELGETPRKALGNLLNYLSTHQNHIQYHQFKAQGLPIGSGMVESACKWLILQRFKGVGMRWSFDGFDSLLHIRLAWVNQRFDELFTSSPN